MHELLVSFIGRYIYIHCVVMRML